MKPSNEIPRPRRLRGCLIISLNSAIALLALVAGLELVLRFYYKVERFPLQPVSALLNMEILPAQVDLLSPPPFVTDRHGILVANPALLGVNSEGYRTPDFNEPANGRKTILVLGDSFTWGLAAEPLSICFADHLRDAGYKVINLGIPGTGPAQYAAQAAEYVPLLKPDAVCVMFYPANDFQIDAPVKPGIRRSFLTTAGFLAACDENGAPISFDDARAHYAKVMGTGNDAVIRRAVSSTAIGVTVGRIIGNLARQDRRVVDVRGRLGEIQTVCQANNAKFLLFLLPVRPTCMNEFNYARAVAETLREFSPIVGPAFGEERYAGNADEHFNNTGHAEMADFMIRKLTGDGLAPVTTGMPATTSTVPVSIHALTQQLHLGTETEALVLGQLDGLKDRLCDLYLAKAKGEADCPASILARQIELQTPQPEQAFAEFLRNKMPEGDGKTYAELRAGVIAACRDTMAKSLSPEQSAAITALPDDVLEAIFTGHVPFDGQPSKLAARQGAANLGVKAGANGSIAWADFARALQLDAAQEPVIKNEIESYKRAVVALMERPTKAGGPSPMDFIASQIAAGTDEVAMNEAASSYAQTNEDIQDGKTYFMLFRDSEAPYRDRLLAPLREDQHGRFRQLAVPSLLKIDTGNDVVGNAIRAHAKGLGSPNAATISTWAKLNEVLKPDEGQAAAIRHEITLAKEGRAEIMGRAAKDGGPAPIDVMAQQIVKGKTGEELDKTIGEYTHTKLDNREGLTYDELGSALEKTHRAKLMALLNEVQRSAVEKNGLGSLLTFDVGGDPMGKAVGTRVEKLKGEQPGASKTGGPGSWVTLKAMLNLRPEQAEQAKAIINQLKDDVFMQLSRKPPGDAVSPVEFLRAELKKDSAAALAHFQDYVKSNNDPATGKPYMAGMQQAETLAHDAIAALLNDAQRLRLQKVALGPLSEIATGHDPLGDALK